MFINTTIGTLTPPRGNRFYHLAIDPGRIFCESFNRVWWMVYETSSHVSSLLKYLHPSGIEEQALLQAIVELDRVIARGIAARHLASSPSAFVAAEGKKLHPRSKALGSSAAGQSLGAAIPDWLADAEGSFVARHLMALNSDFAPASMSAVVAPGVGYSDLKVHAGNIAVGVGAVDLFGQHAVGADGEAFSDADELLISKHWLPSFLRRRQFSNHVRLYENSLHYSGFRSLCSQAHAVNRLLSPLTGSSPTKSCFAELQSLFPVAGDDGESTDSDGVHAGGTVSTAPLAEQGSETNDMCAPIPLATVTPVPAPIPLATVTPVPVPQRTAPVNQSGCMPGVYNPIDYLKAHSIRLSVSLFSVVKPSFEGNTAFRLFFLRLNTLSAVNEFSKGWRLKVFDSESCADVKTVILELEEVGLFVVVLFFVQIFCQLTSSLVSFRPPSTISIPPKSRFHPACLPSILRFFDRTHRRFAS